MTPVKNRRAYLIVFFWLVVFTRFFDFIPLVKRPVVYICILLYAYFYFISKKDEENTKSMIGIAAVFTFISCLYSFLHHHQSLPGVIHSTYFALGLLFFCVPLYYRLDYKNSLKLVRNFCVLFCVCYIIQYLVYPIELFSGVRDEFSVTVNQFRMRMTCSLCSYTLFLYGVNYLFLKKRIIYVFYIIIGFIPVIIMGFRSLIALLLLTAFYTFVKITGKSLRAFFVGLIISVGVVAFALQTDLVQDKIEEMMERQESDQTFDNDEYVRYLSLAFYVTEVYTEPMERLLGGGVPIVSLDSDQENKTSYAKQIAAGYVQGLFWNDLGLIGLALVIGPISTLLIIFLMLRTCWKCKSDQLLFIRCAILTGLLGSVFTSQEIYRAGNFIFVALLMYTDYRYRLEHSKI